MDKMQTTVRHTASNTKRGVSVIIDIEADKAWARTALQGLNGKIAKVLASRASDVVKTMFGGDNDDS